MQPKKYKSKELNLGKFYPILILIATLFMGVAYAQISDVELNITGSTSGEAQDGVFIIDIAYKSNVSADVDSSNINYYLGTMMDSKIVLGATSTSSITYEVTMYNSTDKDYVFIGALVDKTDTTVYSNSNITYSVNIEEYETIIPAGESLTFEVTFSYVGTDVSNNILESKLNFRFREEPIIDLSCEGETIEISDIYPGSDTQEYEFTVMNYNENEEINGVPMTYTFETTMEENSPLTAKIYDEAGTEVTGSVSLEDDGVTKTDTVYTLKILWDETNNSSDYANKEYTCNIKLNALPEDETYGEYKIEKEFNVNIKTAPFYFNINPDATDITMENDEASITLNLNNYNSSTEYNIYDTNYEISLEDTSKFAISLTDSNSGILTSGANKNEILVTITPVEGATINEEEQVKLIVKTTNPYEKKETIAINIIYVEAEPEGPILLSGMTPVAWDNNKEEFTPTTNEEWYDYESQLWANAVTEDGSYWVWIPRFEYKVTAAPSTTASSSNAGTIDVRFIGTDIKEGSSGYTTTDGITTSSDGYIIHPAFTNNVDVGGWDSELRGFWVAKYEMSMETTSDSGATWTATTTSSDTIGNVAISDTVRMVSKPGVTSWRYINISNCYENSYNYNRDNESHLMKNSEWGAVAYLTHSSYGRNGTKVSTNTGSYYTAGSANATANTNVKQSTTGNNTGIFDLAGCAYDNLAVFNDKYSSSGTYYSKTNTSYCSSTGNNMGAIGLANGGSTKYLTAYSNSTSYYYVGQNTSYPSYESFENAGQKVSITGDATEEVHVSSDRGWFNNPLYFVYSETAFLKRGGYYAMTLSSIFNADKTSGSGSEFNSFRVCLTTSVKTGDENGSDTEERKLVEFTIGSVTCYTEEDMTWGEWVADTSLNTIGAQIYNDFVIIPIDTEGIENECSDEGNHPDGYCYLDVGGFSSEGSVLTYTQYFVLDCYAGRDPDM